MTKSRVGAAVGACHRMSTGSMAGKPSLGAWRDCRRGGMGDDEARVGADDCDADDDTNDDDDEGHDADEDDHGPRGRGTQH